jgi:septal ring factor EnvC (AmiA/AmiB activator)
MNTTQPDIGELIRTYINEVNAAKRKVIDDYEQELSDLKSKKDAKLKEIDSKLDDIRKEFKPSIPEKPSRKKNKRMNDSEISEAIKNILTNNASKIKTDELYTKIGIQRPRFDKYTKSSECIINAEKEGRTLYWSLK